MGLWHGSDLAFLIYGLYHGGIIISSFLLDGVYKKVRHKLGINTDGIAYKVFCTVRTFLLVSFGYVFFVTGDFSASVNLIVEIFTHFNITALFTGSAAAMGLTPFTLLQIVLLIFFLMLMSDVLKPRRTALISPDGQAAFREVFMCITLIMCVIIAWLLLYSAGDYTSQFIYFEF